MQAYVDTDGCRMAFLGRLLNDPAAGGLRPLRERRRRALAAVGGAGPRAGGRRLPAAGRAGDRPAAPVAGGGADREADRDRAGAVHPGRPGVGEGRRAGRRRAGPGPDLAVRGSPRRRRDGGDPGPLAPEPDAGVGDLRAVRDPAGVRGGVRAAAGERARAAVRRVPDVRRRARRRPRWPTARPRPRTRGRSWAWSGGPSGPGPVLLVDDLVDSRWTLTVAGSLLREHGAGPVLPFALAVATPRGE